MKTLFVVILFFGILVFMHGYYEQRVQSAKTHKKIEYRFIPRTYYDDQFFGEKPSALFKDNFQKESPWSERLMVTPQPRSSSS
jgi:hypothetical protein